jgi:spore germination protein
VIAGRIILPLIAAAALWAAGCGATAGHAPATTVDVHRTDATGASPGAGAADHGASGTSPAALADRGVARTSPAALADPSVARTSPVAALADHAGTSTSRAAASVHPAGHERAVSVWLPYWNMSAALRSTLANASLVGAASPFWYAIAGTARVQDDPGAGEASVLEALRAHHIRVVPTVTEEDGMREFDRLLASPEQRAAMVDALVGIARSRNYDGLDLDFENFAVDPHHDAAPADEAAARFPTLVAEACAALHAAGRTCAVTVMPRTGDAHTYWRGRLATWVYDYRALASVADRVQVMAYDEHAPEGPAGAIAPYAWTRRVVAYAAMTMPPAKVELGLAAYGYDWQGDSASSIPSNECPRLAAQHGVSPRWSAPAAEDTFTYTREGQRHVVWYESSASEYIRARLAQAAGFAGIALWAAGDEEPSLWLRLRALYG